MPNQKTSDLTPITNPASTDVLYIISGGVSRKITVADLAAYMFLAPSPITITANTALNATYGLIACDATTGAFTATLPLASTCTGKKFSLKKIDVGPNVVTVITTAPDLIDSIVSTYLLELYNEFVQLESTGSSWLVTAE